MESPKLKKIVQLYLDNSFGRHCAFVVRTRSSMREKALKGPLDLLLRMQPQFNSIVVSSGDSTPFEELADREDKQLSLEN